VTVVFAGGGTGGHLYPAIAIADALRERRARVLFIGSADRLETQIVPNAGYPLQTIAAHSLPRRPSLKLFAALARNVRGTLQSLRLLAAARADLVVATGGYVCFPVALAARIRRALGRSRAPLVLFEPNVSPGLTSRLLAPLADEIWGVCAGFTPAIRMKCRNTGIPVRSRLRELPSRDAAAARLGLDAARPVLLVVGGSQGARALNDAVATAWTRGELPAGWQVLALTGEGEAQRVRAAVGSDAAFVVRAYLEEMGDAYAVADLVLARAGASTLAELAALAMPAVLVPYPHATEAHQTANAEAVAAAGAAVVLPDSELASGALPGVLAEVTQTQRLAWLRESARRLAGDDPLAAILARVESLTCGKSER
jgi:UDP-N-acetylglucosamine--N-acetylmuramyl-(pentapeptide) pyrophosphoryl-undecaprenol N-acetylglucosamine transferase